MHTESRRQNSFVSFAKGLLFTTRVDRYVMGEVLGPFIGGLIFFIFIFLMFQALRLADFFIVHGVPGVVLGKMTALMCLSFMSYSLPPAFLFAVLLGFGRLSSDSELVALKANGWSLGRLSIPIFSFSILILALSIFLHMEWVPWGERNLKRTLIKVGNTKVVSSIQEGTFTAGFFDLLIFADKVDPKTNEMQRVFLFDERDAKNPLAIVARKGQIYSVKTDSDLGAAALLKLKNGSIHRNDLNEKTYQKIDFQDYRLFLQVDEGQADDANKPSQFSYHQLKEKIAKSDNSSWESREWEVELWRRFSVSFTPLLFVFLGIGFGTFRTRAVRAGAVLVALVTLGVYWTSQTFAVSLIQSQVVGAFTGMQIPNLLVLITGAWAFRKSSW